MRKTTIVVAVLAATVASAEAAPKSSNLSRGTSVTTSSQQSASRTVARTATSQRPVNFRGAASVPHQAGKPFGAAAFTPARHSGAQPAPTVRAAATQAKAGEPAVRPTRKTSRSAVRSAKAGLARSEARRVATVRRLSVKTRTVALTREVPSVEIERPAAAVTAAAPTGTIPSMVTAAAQNAGVNPALGHAVVKVESMYKPRATGKGGYIGLMQLSYQTARGMGFRGSRQALYEPSANLQYGMRYLAEAVRKAGGNTCAAVSKYQGGHAVRGVTRAGAVYCAKVRRYMASAG